MVPRPITHHDGFEIPVTQGDTRLTIYDLGNTQGDDFGSMEHEGHFLGSSNRACVRKTSAELIQIRPIILPGFKFFSGNAAQFKIRTVLADGNIKDLILEPILKKTHETQRKNPTGFPWLHVKSTEAPQGTMTISVTRGIVDHQTAMFSPLSGGEGTPYTIDVSWRQVETVASLEQDAERVVTRSRNKAPSTPPKVTRKRFARTAKPKTKKSFKKLGDSTAAESTRAEDAMELDTAGDHKGSFEPNMDPKSDSQEQSAPTSDPKQDQPLPIRLRDGDKEVVPVSPKQNSGGEGVEEPMTSPTYPVDFDKAPIHLAEGADSSPSPTLAHKINATRAPTAKRNADEAFDTDRVKDIASLEFEVTMARANFDVDNARLEEMTDKFSPKYLHLVLKMAQSRHSVAEAELDLKVAQLDGKKDTEYLELKTREAEAHLEVVEAEEKTMRETNLVFKRRKAHAELGVAEAKVEQMAHKGGKDNFEYLQLLLSKAQADSGVITSLFEIKAAACGVDKDAEYYELQTRKAEAHRAAVQAQGRLMLKSDLRL